MDAILAIPAGAGRAQLVLQTMQALQAASFCRLPGLLISACRRMASAGAT